MLVLLMNRYYHGANIAHYFQFTKGKHEKKTNKKKKNPDLHIDSGFFLSQP